MSIFKDWPLATSSLLLIIGLALGSYLQDWVLPSLFFIFWASFIAYLLLILKKDSWQIIPIGLALVAVGVLVASIHWQFFPKVQEQQGEFTVIVKSSPVIKYSRQQAYVDRDDGVRLRAIFPAEIGVNYGDVYLVEGLVEPPRQDVNFNEEGFLLAHRTSGRLEVAKAEIKSEKAGSPVLQILHLAKAWLVNRVNSIFSEPYNQLIAGVLLGDNTNMSADFEEIFRRTGTSHILVASGSNVLVVAWVAIGVLSFFGKGVARNVSLMLVFCFVVVSGGDASIIRAAIFYLLIVLAAIIGRRPHTITLVSAVGLLMSLINPWLILYDVAFQLSFAAVVGLMVFSDWFEELLSNFPFKEVLAPTLAAQLTTLPILLLHFGQVSLVAPFANFFIVPLIPIIMAGSALALVFPWFSILPWITEGLGAIVVFIINWLSSLSWASYNVSANNLPWAAVAILLVGVVYWIKNHATKTT